MYNVPYSHITTKEELLKIKEEAKEDSIICVGGYNKDENSNNLILCCFDEAGEVF